MFWLSKEASKLSKEVSKLNKIEGVCVLFKGYIASSIYILL